MLTRRNCSRCSSRSFATKPATGTGRRRVRRSEPARDCAAARRRSTPAGGRRRPSASGISRVPGDGQPVARRRAATGLEPDLAGRARISPLGNSTSLGVQVVLDLLDVLLLLGALVADQLAGLVPADPGDIGDQFDLLGGEREQVERDVSSLCRTLQRSAFEPFCAQSSSYRLFGRGLRSGAVRRRGRGRAVASRARVLEMPGRCRGGL